MNKKVILVGLMGSGKSFWGERLAAALGLPWIDLDAVIEQSEGQTVSDIFATSGESVFRTLEREHLLQTLTLPAFVLSVGGGAPCFFDNMARMNAQATTIYLETPLEILLERLQNESSKRPLLQGATEADLFVRLQALMRQRASYYEQAQHTVGYDPDARRMMEALLKRVASI